MSRDVRIRRNAVEQLLSLSFLPCTKQRRIQPGVAFHYIDLFLGIPSAALELLRRFPELGFEVVRQAKVIVRAAVVWIQSLRVFQIALRIINAAEVQLVVSAIAKSLSTDGFQLNGAIARRNPFVESAQPSQGSTARKLDFGAFRFGRVCLVISCECLLQLAGSKKLATLLEGSVGLRPGLHGQKQKRNQQHELPSEFREQYIHHLHGRGATAHFLAEITLVIPCKSAVAPISVHPCNIA